MVNRAGAASQVALQCNAYCVCTLRFALGSLRDETQYLYGFTLANFGSVGDIRRSNTVFRDQAAPPPY